MILLHAGLTDGCLYLWGETPHEGMRNSGGASSRFHPPPYPYDAGTDGLRAACGAVQALHAAANRNSVEAIIHLPAPAGKPVASSRLIADPPASRAQPTIHPFVVTALELFPEEIIGLLELATKDEPPAAGVIAGSTLKFWVEAYRLAVWLAVREQFLPGLLHDGERYQACWEPVLTGDGMRRATALARRMPDACRALALGMGKPPDAAAQSTLSEFLHITLDALVLRALRHEEEPALSPRRRGRRAQQATKPFASIDERWARALRTESGVIAGTDAELEELAGRLATWKRPLMTATTTLFRLCFRLEEPPESGGEENRWYLRYLLQSTDDPSLLIDVVRIWRNGKGRPALPADMGANPREHLLTELGRASRLVPEVESSLRSQAPSGFELDATGAHAFLHQSAWLLEQAGFGVLLPAWWTRKGPRRLTARAVVQSPKLSAHSGLTLETIADVDWNVALGDQVLSHDDLQRLARLKAPLVRMRGEWVELQPEEIEAALAYWTSRKQKNTRMQLRDIIRMALGAARAPGGLELAEIEAVGAAGDMLARLQGSRSPGPIPVPEGFHGTLRPYQERGLAWLAFLRSLGFGACLADDMGLGKTIQTLALLQHDREAGERRPALLVCPTSVMGNWHREAERFTPDLPVMLHHGLARRKGSNFTGEAEKAALVITSYPLLHRDAGTLGAMTWAGVILDEAQNIKNPETRQAHAARILESDYRIALTGTPVENHVGDLWSIMEFLNPGFLGSRTAFNRTFFLPIQAEHDPVATERLKKLTGPFILRRLKTDRSIIADLPQKQEMKVFCTLTREQASLYKAVVDEMTASLDDFDGIQRRGMVLAGLSRLKQVCNHPAQFLGDNSATAGRSGKLDRLTEMLEEVLAADDRALIFTQFAEMGAIMKRHLQETFGEEVLFLHGATPPKQRDRMVERFQGTEAPPIFILSLKAGGSGLNLTAAAHVFHFDRWWNPAVENQATDRAFRIGQQRNVQVHKFLCAGTVEEKIDEMIERKQEIAENIVGGGESLLTTLSTAELRRIIELSADALGEE